MDGLPNDWLSSREFGERPVGRRLVSHLRLQVSSIRV